MKSPNILCISIDSVRSDFAPLKKGDGYHTTPFLNSLISESTVYRNALSPSTWTLPVHTSIFTGLFPLEHGVTTGEKILGNHPTFAELLSETGYSTRAFYHYGWFDTGDINRGFSTFKPQSFQKNNSSNTKEEMFSLIKDLCPKLANKLKKIYFIQNQYRKWQNISYGEESTDDREIVNMIENSDRKVDSPFCWFVHFDGAHWKYNPPAPFHQEYTDRNDIALAYNYGIWQDRVYGGRTNRLKTIAGKISPPEREVQTFKHLYRGGIKYCDHLIKDIINYLKRISEWEKTVLVVFGDHGEAFGDDGVYGHHFTIHDSVLRVPLLIRDPTGRINTGSVTKPVSLIDLYPTLLNLAGVSPPETAAIDLADEKREFSYAYYDISELDYYTDAEQYGVRKSDLPRPKKFVIWNPRSKGVLFPKEDKFQASGEQDIETLRTSLERHTERLKKIETESGEMSDSVKSRLEDLGYR